MNREKTIWKKVLGALEINSIPKPANYSPKILDLPPPSEIYEALKTTFGDLVNFEKGCIFTYGWDIHVKGGKLTRELYAHELTHCFQQHRWGKKIWWKKYLADPKFRLEQELEAHQSEVEACKLLDRNQRSRHTSYVAQKLSSSLYGKLISYPDALKLLNHDK